MKKDFLTSFKESFSNSKRDSILVLIAVICALVCVAACIACLISVSNATKGIETVVQEVREIKQASAELTERITQLEITVDNTQLTLSQNAANRYIKITKQPSSVSTYVGRSDAMMFSIQAQGTNLRFTWQMYNTAKSAWEEVVFDGNGFNTTLGIRLFDDSGSGNSELWTKDLQSGAFGSYRCVVTDGEGSTVTSETAQLTERPAP